VCVCVFFFDVCACFLIFFIFHSPPFALFQAQQLAWLLLWVVAAMYSCLVLFLGGEPSFFFLFFIFFIIFFFFHHNRRQIPARKS
jgi:hypothetical protein